MSLNQDDANEEMFRKKYLKYKEKYITLLAEEQSGAGGLTILTEVTADDEKALTIILASLIIEYNKLANYNNIEYKNQAPNKMIKELKKKISIEQKSLDKLRLKTDSDKKTADLEILERAIKDLNASLGIQQKLIKKGEPASEDDYLKLLKQLTEKFVKPTSSLGAKITKGFHTIKQTVQNVIKKQV